MMKYLEALLPANEAIGIAFREEVTMYPSVSVRECAANQIIHNLRKAFHKRCYGKKTVMQSKVA
jgi:hypothetical protein